MNADGRGGRSHRTSWFFRLCVGLLSLLLGAGVFVALIHSSRAMDSELAAIRASGLPTTIAELNDWFPEPPPEENAALVYIQAAQALQNPSPPLAGLLPFHRLEKLPGAGEPLSEESLAAIDEFLEMNSSALQIARGALSKPGSKYMKDYSQFARPAPWLTDSGRLVRLFFVEAIGNAERGDVTPPSPSKSIVFATTNFLNRSRASCPNSSRNFLRP